jgi:hypothetical protein
VVDVILSDMGGTMGMGMVGSRRMMNVSASASVVGVGDLSFRVLNAGMMVHELVVVPLPASGAGTRSIGLRRPGEGGGEPRRGFEVLR